MKLSFYAAFVDSCIDEKCICSQRCVWDGWLKNFTDKALAFFFSPWSLHNKKLWNFVCNFSGRRKEERNHNISNQNNIIHTKTNIQKCQAYKHQELWAFQTLRSCWSCYVSVWRNLSNCKLVPNQMHRLSSSRHYKRPFDWRFVLVCCGGAEGFCFLLRGVNDNRPQTMADAWPSQMWRTAANSKEFQGIAGFRGEGLTAQTLQFSLDGWSSLIRGPFICKTNEILWLKRF